METPTHLQPLVHCLFLYSRCTTVAWLHRSTVLLFTFVLEEKEEVTSVLLWSVGTLPEKFREVKWHTKEVTKGLAAHNKT